MRIFLNIILVSIFITSCSLYDNDDKFDNNDDKFDDVDYNLVQVELTPDTAQISDELVFSLVVVNDTQSPIWYNHCGQVREVLINSEWKPTGAVICYLETEGVRIDAGQSFEKEVTYIRISEPEILRLVLNLKDNDREFLPLEVRRTNSVTVLHDQE
jgi:hypothetical protein